MLKELLISPAQPRRAETSLFPGSVLASLKPSTEGGNSGGGFPFAKIHDIGEGPHEVRSVPPPDLRSLRPCLEQGASQGEESVLADLGWEGEITARVGRVRRLAFLSILQ
jgi:hypothetical protein